MRIYDISPEISEKMTVYKDKQEKKPVLYKKTVNDVTETRLSIDTHTGAHIDAPLHMIPSGKGLEVFPLEAFYGECKVFDLTKIKEKITADDLKPLNIEENDRVIFKTKNSSDSKFNLSFVYLDISGAKYLSEKKIALVGIDALGIERNQSGHETHKVLLGKKIPI